MSKLPQVTVLNAARNRVVSGYPWLRAADLRLTSRERTEMPGAVVELIDEKNSYLATAHFNPNSSIMARVLSRRRDETIDQEFYKARLDAAHSLRDALFDLPYYRLVHAEGDNLPGLIIDRFDDVFSIQTNTAGMDGHKDLIVAALLELFSPRAIVAHNDSAARAREGLPQVTALLHGQLDQPVFVKENGALFEIDLLHGQKTGWFYDHRENRRFIASIARDQSVLDGYCYMGSFGIEAAVAGAAFVVSLDRSDLAIHAAQKSAALSHVTDRWRGIKNDVFDQLTEFAAGGTQFDIVVMDPPAFIKHKKDHTAGLKGYQKMTKLAASLVKPGGHLMIASCSHHAKLPELTKAALTGLAHANRRGKLIRSFGADRDHPVHPHLS